MAPSPEIDPANPATAVTVHSLSSTNKSDRPVAEAAVNVGGADLPRGKRRVAVGRNVALTESGLRARSEILAAAFRLFARNGYQGTTVEAIGEATGRSGAAVYQYFEGKYEIFLLLVHDMLDDLTAGAGELPEITADAGGVQRLESWISTMFQVVRRHEAVLLLWSQVQHLEPPTEEHMRRLGEFLLVLSARLAAGGAVSPTPDITPLVTMSVIHWSYFGRLLWPAAVPEISVVRAIAEMLHPYLLRHPDEATVSREPHPPVFVSPSDLMASDGPGLGDDSVPTLVSGDDPVPAGGPASVGGMDVGGSVESTSGADATGSADQDDGVVSPDAPGLRRRISTRAAPTVQRILSAAAERFVGKGFYGTSVSDIAAAAGVSHGSVYTYWRDRDALFATLAHEAVRALDRQGPSPGPDSNPSGWLNDWMSLIRRHGSVLHVWIHEVPNEAWLAGIATKKRDSIATIASGLTAGLPPGPPDLEQARRLVRWALLCDVPYVLWVQLRALDRESMQTVICALLDLVPSTPVAEPATTDAATTDAATTDAATTDAAGSEEGLTRA